MLRNIQAPYSPPKPKAPSQPLAPSIKPRMGHPYTAGVCHVALEWLCRLGASTLLERGQSPRPQDSARASAYPLLRQTFQGNVGKKFCPDRGKCPQDLASERERERDIPSNCVPTQDPLTCLKKVFETNEGSCFASAS